MAVYNREQVGSSFKPYILSTAVKLGMNVQTSTLNGYDNLVYPAGHRAEDVLGYRHPGRPDRLVPGA